MPNLFKNHERHETLATIRHHNLAEIVGLSWWNPPRIRELKSERENSERGLHGKPEEGSIMEWSRSKMVPRAYQRCAH